ncbi:M42 family metallopeptidase [Thermocaproicibacter melissae]|jgi:putative aminopeptidase FrvX|uniref:M42 family metallopeptidase n=1 Tax=Thermocaproicibacter melissae TaxID=2966552 RepID=UPI0024B06DF1|nr:M42 family metallopeptidase [Thermocaproicibacter melissae]WBY64683.1 M42 family metallopeptidase [Thermocaproicibacter melissae]
MEYILEQLKKLMSIDSPSGFTGEVTRYTMEQFQKLGFQPYLTNKGCVVCDLGGEGNPLILSAHIDTLGGMVAEIKKNGRLRITNIGGLNANNCETENCRIYTRSGQVFEGTLQMNDPSIHVNKKFSEQSRTFEDMEIVLDEDVKSKQDTEALGIRTGDFVCFEPRTVITKSGYIKSRFLDDKLSVAILLGLAKRISEKKISLKRKVYVFITVYEEVGHGACGALPVDAKEIISVDMGCVGEGLACTERMVSICVKDSQGPYDYDVTTELIRCAESAKLDFAVDVYPHYGSDADAALAAGYDLKHGLIGAGVYASHGYERSHIDGVNNTLKLLQQYIRKD